MSAVLTPARTAPPTAARPVTQARVIRSEWAKLRGLRSTWYSALVTVVLIVGVGAGFAAGKPYRVSAAHPAVTAVSVSLFGILIAQLVIGVLGVLVFSGEYGTGMIRASLAVVPIKAAGAVGEAGHGGRPGAAGDHAGRDGRLLRGDRYPVGPGR